MNDLEIVVSTQEYTNTHHSDSSEDDYLMQFEELGVKIKIAE